MTKAAGTKGGAMVLRAGRSTIAAKQHKRLPDGQVQVLVHLSEAARPDRQYSAHDVCFLFEHPIGVLHFFQRSYVKDVFRSAVAVRLSTDSLVNFAETSGDFMQRLASSAAVHNWPNYDQIVPTTEPDNATTLDANAMSVTQISSDTYFDFFQFDVTGVRDVMETAEVTLDGVVRVIAPSHVALAALTHLIAAAHKLQTASAGRADLLGRTKEKGT